MKRKMYAGLLIFLLLSLTGCGNVSKLVCKQYDKNLNITHEITIEYKNGSAKKYINKYIFEDVDAAKKIEAYETLGVSQKPFKRKDNTLYQTFKTNEYKKVYGKDLRKKVEERKMYEEKGYTCEEKV